MTGVPVPASDACSAAMPLPHRPPKGDFRGYIFSKVGIVPLEHVQVPALADAMTCLQHDSDSDTRHGNSFNIERRNSDSNTKVLYAVGVKPLDWDRLECSVASDQVHGGTLVVLSLLYPGNIPGC